MLTKAQQDRIAKKLTSTLVNVIGSLPDYLSKSEPEAASKVIALLMRAQLSAPPPEDDEDIFMDGLFDDNEDEDDEIEGGDYDEQDRTYYIGGQETQLS